MRFGSDRWNLSLLLPRSTELSECICLPVPLRPRPENRTPNTACPPLGNIEDLRQRYSLVSALCRPKAHGSCSGNGGWLGRISTNWPFTYVETVFLYPSLQTSRGKGDRFSSLSGPKSGQLRHRHPKGCRNRPLLALPIWDKKVTRLANNPASTIASV